MPFLHFTWTIQKDYILWNMKLYPKSVVVTGSLFPLQCPAILSVSVYKCCSTHCGNWLLQLSRSAGWCMQLLMVWASWRLSRLVWVSGSCTNQELTAVLISPAERTVMVNAHTVSHCHGFSFHIRAGLQPGSSKYKSRQAALTPIHTDIIPEVCMRSFNIPERMSVPKCSVFSGFSVLSVRWNSTSTLMRAQTSMPQFGQARLTALVLLDGKAAPGRRAAGSY